MLDTPTGRAAVRKRRLPKRWVFGSNPNEHTNYPKLVAAFRSSCSFNSGKNGTKEAHDAGRLGTTPEGRVVVGGIYRLRSTHGIPLEDILFFLHNNNAIPDWLVLFDEMVNEGNMKPKKVFNVLEIAISDIYERDFAAEVIRILKLLRPL